MSLQLIIASVLIILGAYCILFAFSIWKNLNSSVFESQKKYIPSAFAAITGKMHQSFDHPCDGITDEGVRVVQKDEEFIFYTQAKFSEQAGLSALNK